MEVYALRKIYTGEMTMIVESDRYFVFSDGTILDKVSNRIIVPFAYKGLLKVNIRTYNKNKSAKFRCYDIRRIILSAFRPKIGFSKANPISKDGDVSNISIDNLCWNNEYIIPSNPIEINEIKEFKLKELYAGNKIYKVQKNRYIVYSNGKIYDTVTNNYVRFGCDKTNNEIMTYYTINIKCEMEDGSHKYIKISTRRAFASAYFGEPMDGQVYALCKNDNYSDLSIGNVMWGTSADKRRLDRMRNKKAV